MAVHAISWLRQARLGPHLYPLIDDPDEEVRWAAAAGLAVLKDEGSGAPLIHALATDESARVRSAAARALGWMRIVASAPDLRLHLRTDVDPEVRSQAARALGRLRAHDALEDLLSAVSDPAAVVRQGAITALSGIIDAMDDISQAPASVIETFRGRLSDDDAETRALALRALTKTKASDGFTRCMTALRDPNPGVRVTAAIGLRRVANPTAVKTLRDHMGDPHPEVAHQIRETIRSLEGLRSPRDADKES